MKKASRAGRWYSESTAKGREGKLEQDRVKRVVEGGVEGLRR